MYILYAPIDSYFLPPNTSNTISKKITDSSENFYITITMITATSLPKGLKPGIFASLLLTCESIDYADKFIAKTFPNIAGYSEKFDILSNFFEFKMIDRYSPEELTQEDIIESDYWFTLQHLLNKAKVVGVAGVIKPDM